MPKILNMVSWIQVNDIGVLNDDVSDYAVIIMHPADIPLSCS